MTVSDLWSQWLLRDRHGDDPGHERVLRAGVEAYADRILDAADVAPGMTIADIGCGDGLMAFRAIERLGPSINAVLSDISAPLLDHARALAAARGLSAQCRFIKASADDMRGLEDATVDVVFTRAVLAYVHDRPAALREFLRVLKPGGRVSIGEPILQDEALNAIALKRAVSDLPRDSGSNMVSLIHRWKAAQYPDTPEGLRANPLTNYSERDLVWMFQQAGFIEVHMQLHIHVRECKGMDWETFVASAPHPWAPTLRAVLDTQFTPTERRHFENALRPAVEAGVSDAVDRMVYLTADKPAR